MRRGRDWKRKMCGGLQKFRWGGEVLLCEGVMGGVSDGKSMVVESYAADGGGVSDAADGGASQSMLHLQSDLIRALCVGEDCTTKYKATK